MGPPPAARDGAPQRPLALGSHPAPAPPIKHGAGPSRAALAAQWAKAAAPGRIQTRRGAGAAAPMEPRLVGPGPYRATRLVSDPAAIPDTAALPRRCPPRPVALRPPGAGRYSQAASLRGRGRPGGAAG